MQNASDHAFKLERKPGKKTNFCQQIQAGCEIESVIDIAKNSQK